jgi:cell division protein FtsL
MSPELIIMPILAMISGIASLFIDPKNSRIKWSKPLMLTLIVLSAIATVSFGYQNQKYSQERESQNKQQINSLLSQNVKLEKKIEEIPNRITDILKSFGYTSQSASSATAVQISQSGEANLQLSSNSQIVKSQDVLRRQLVTVQYFPKDVDPAVVLTTLKKLGFKFKISQPNVLDIRTNAIWFGSKVNMGDVKLVAYTLIRAGVKVQTIKPFRGNPTEPWASLIQVGADSDYVNKPALTVLDIRNAKDFPRTN